MKKLLLPVIATWAIGVSSTQAQIKVVSIDKLPTPAGMIIDQATISGDAGKIILSDIAANNLSLYDTATKSVTAIANSENCYDVKFSPDNRSIGFRQNSFDENHLRYQSVVTVNLESQKATTIVAPSRTVSGFNVANTGATALDGRKLKATGSAPKATVGIDRGNLVVTINGTTTAINPQGERSYIWPQLSPDQTRIVYWGDGVGCYVCNLDGSNPVLIGCLHAPQWLDNETIIGMNDIDDGHNIIESSIVAVKADGTEGQKLTPSNMIAIYPTASADGTKVAFTNPRGQAFIMTLSR